VDGGRRCGKKASTSRQSAASVAAAVGRAGVRTGDAVAWRSEPRLSAALLGDEAPLGGGVQWTSNIERRRAHGEMRSGGSSKRKIS
jgi:hypothetical protein